MQIQNELDLVSSSIQDGSFQNEPIIFQKSQPFPGMQQLLQLMTSGIPPGSGFTELFSFANISSNENPDFVNPLTAILSGYIIPTIE